MIHIKQMHIIDVRYYERIQKKACADYEHVLTKRFGDMNEPGNARSATTYMCSLGNMEAIKWILDFYPDTAYVLNTMSKECSFGNDIEFLRYILIDLGLFDSKEGVLQLMRDKRCSIEKFECLMELRKHVDHTCLIKVTCDAKNICVVKHILDKYGADDIHDIFQYACICDNYIAKWLLATYPQIDVHANDCVAFKNAYLHIPFNKYNMNGDLLVSYTQLDDISYHIENSDPTVNGIRVGYIISTRSLSDVWNHTKYIEEYDIYVYSSHDIDNANIDLAVYNMYVRRLRQAPDRSKKSARK